MDGKTNSLSTRSGAGVGPEEDEEDEEATSGNVDGPVPAGEGVGIGDAGCGGGCSCASCASARTRSTRVIEFLSKTRRRSVSPSRGRSEGDVAVWSFRRERFESQAVVSMLWNMSGFRCWVSGEGGVGSGKAGGAVAELPSVVVSVGVEDVLNDEEVGWAVAVGDEEEGQAPRRGALVVV